MKIRQKQLIIPLTFLLFLGAQQAASSQITSNWTASGGNANFYNLGNWDNGIPGSDDEAVFAIAGPFTVNMDNDAFIKTFTHVIGTLTLTGGNELNVGSTLELNGFLAVANEGSTLNLQTDMHLGVDEQAGVVLLNGADCDVAGDALLGLNGNVGGLTANGNGTTFSSDVLFVGLSGEGNLLIQNSAVVNSTIGQVGISQAFAGEATVTGNGAQWNNENSLAVGVGSGNGTLNIVNGGRASSDATGSIGANSGSSGTVNVHGTGSAFSITGLVNVGDNGVGALNVSNGGNATVDLLRIGRTTTADGEVNVGNGGVVDSTTLIVGRAGSGELNISDGGDVTSEFGTIGETATGIGEVTLTGAGSQWSVNDFLIVAENDGMGALNIQNGSRTVVGVNAFIGGFASTQTTTTGMINVTGENSELVVPDFLMVGNNGTGTLGVSDEGSVVAGTVRIGRRPNSSGAALVFNEGFILADNVVVGREGEGVLSITNMGTVACNTAIIGELPGGTGAISVSDFSALDCIDLEVGAVGTGLLNIRDSGFVNVMGDAVIQPNSEVVMGNPNSGFAGQLAVNGTTTISGDLRLFSAANVSGDIELIDDGSIISLADDISIIDNVSSFGRNIFVQLDTALNFLKTFTGNAPFLGEGTAKFYGQVEPGLTTDSLSFAGNVELESTAELKMQIGGSIPGVSYDQLLVGGDISLAGDLSIEIVNNYTPVAGQEYTLIEIDELRSNVFNGLGQGAVVQTVGNLDLVINYFGGDGNDITVVAVPRNALLGDVNLDGVVDLLDVGPFVILLSNNVFQTEADVNQDGIVSLLDVGPFVAILSGG